MAFPQVTPLGAPPSRNNPATFRALMDARMAEQNTLVTEINAFGAALNGYTASGVPFVAAGGTANALTISLPERDAALTNMFFFAPGLSNTSTTVTINLNGEGARAVKTPTGNNPPVGYLGNGGMGAGILPFVAMRGGSEWIVRRQDEYGSNANGEYWKLGNGLLICKHTPSPVSLAISTGYFGGFRSNDQVWTFPYQPVAVPAFTPREINGTAFSVTGRTLTSATAAYAWTDVSSQSAALREVSLTATGRWF